MVVCVPQTYAALESPLRYRVLYVSSIISFRQAETSANQLRLLPTSLKPVAYRLKPRK
jgi:hypothetical protein